jgi:hypothetical protein
MRNLLAPLVYFLPCVLASSLPVKLHLKRSVDSGLANIHVSCSHPISSEVVYTYGPCDAKTPGEAHHLVGRTASCDHDRILWKLPEHAPTAHCLSAWDSNQNLFGRSDTVDIVPSPRTAGRRLKKRQENVSIKMDNSSGIDAEGLSRPLM